MSLLGITTNGKIGLGLVALAFIAFALVSSFVLPRRNPDFPGRRLGAYLAVATLLFVAMLAAVVVFAKESEEAGGAEVTETSDEPEETQTGTTTETETGGETETGTATGGAAGDAAAGEAVFASAGCGGCHTLEAAGSSGNIGPNLDESQPDAALVEQRVRNGAGAMPAFEDDLDDKQIADVTAFVVASTSG
ncbi:MAG: cytochrome c [Gaiellaceae bacterium MAG52_C11]|nr:cytochrome c [Candidatus Gaiellasilicea maunaloa]